MTRQKAFSDYLQEPIVTIRNGRYVLPAKQEYASRVQGIVHDQSCVRTDFVFGAIGTGRDAKPYLSDWNLWKEMRSREYRSEASALPLR